MIEIIAQFKFQVSSKSVEGFVVVLVETRFFIYFIYLPRVYKDE